MPQFGAKSVQTNSDYHRGNQICLPYPCIATQNKYRILALLCRIDFGGPQFGTKTSRRTPILVSCGGEKKSLRHHTPNQPTHKLCTQVSQWRWIRMPDFFGGSWHGRKIASTCNLTKMTTGTEMVNTRHVIFSITARHFYFEFDVLPFGTSWKFTIDWKYLRTPGHTSSGRLKFRDGRNWSSIACAWVVWVGHENRYTFLVLLWSRKYNMWLVISCNVWVANKLLSYLYIERSR